MLFLFHWWAVRSKKAEGNKYSRNCQTLLFGCDELDKQWLFPLHNYGILLFQLGYSKQIIILCTEKLVFSSLKWAALKTNQ